MHLSYQQRIIPSGAVRVYLIHQHALTHSYTHVL